MSHQISQSQRTQNNPFNMGQFEQLSLRSIKGTLGPKNQIVGRRDTNQTSNGGFGGGAYNNWFSFTLLSKGWLIVVKAGNKTSYFNTAVYDLNINPIEGRGIFQDDSIQVNIDGSVYNPYVGQVMGAQSDLYNTFDPNRLDKGDERYYPLDRGTYLLCVSTTRNETLDYEVGVIVEFLDPDFDLLLSNYAFLLTENDEAFENDRSEIYEGQDAHDHSLTEWQTAWSRDNHPDHDFPAYFVPLATVP
jgi:hypothetical protein